MFLFFPPPLPLFQLALSMQRYLLTRTPDDTESLNAVVSLYDNLLRSFGVEEDELYDITEEYKSIKQHRSANC